MDRLNDVVMANPTLLLLERLFWLGLGVFLTLTLITSFIRGLNERKKQMES